MTKVFLQTKGRGKAILGSILEGLIESCSVTTPNEQRILYYIYMLIVFNPISLQVIFDVFIQTASPLLICIVFVQLLSHV